MRRLGTPDEVADVIHFLCEKASSYVSGAEIQINGGQHVQVGVSRWTPLINAQGRNRPRRAPPHPRRRPSRCRPRAQAPGYVQGNLAILPKDIGGRLRALLPAQPQALPAARPRPSQATGACRRWARISTSAPTSRSTACRKKGELVEEVTDLKKVWRDDLVSFVLGCSFSFEEALIENGLELRHQTCNSNVPMYRTSIECKPAGPVPRTDGGVDAAVQAGRRDPRRAGDDTLSLGAWRAGPSRQARAFRHQGHRQARLWRCRAGARRRAPGVLGLRRHPAVGRGDGQKPEFCITTRCRVTCWSTDSASCAARRSPNGGYAHLDFEGHAKAAWQKVAVGSDSWCIAGLDRPRRQPRSTITSQS